MNPMIVLQNGFVCRKDMKSTNKDNQDRATR